MAKNKKVDIDYNLTANSEARWLSVFENMKDMVMIVDKRYLIQSINRIEHGFSKEQVIGQSIFNFITPDKTDFIKQNIQKLFKTGASFEVENLLHGADGKEAWYYGVYSPIIGANGKIDEFMIITRDVTTIKRAEQIVLNALIEGQEAERKRVSGELHDGLGQNLGALSLNLMHLESDLKKLKSAKAEKTFVNIRHLIGKAGAEVKSITHNLAPPGLEELGLAKAIKDCCRHASVDFGVKINFTTSKFNGILDPSLELSIYRMVQELINNSI